MSPTRRAAPVGTASRSGRRRGRRPPTRFSTPSSRASVPLALREAAEGDQAHQSDDEPQYEAPHEHHDDADNDEDATQTNPARVAAGTTFYSHPLPPREVIFVPAARVVRAFSTHALRRTRVLSSPTAPLQRRGSLPGSSCR